MMKISEILANNMRKYRTDQNLTQAELAEKSGLSTNFIHYIETKNRFPSEENIEKIAIALDIEPYQLFAVKETWKEQLVKDVNKALSEVVDKAFEEI